MTKKYQRKMTELQKPPMPDNPSLISQQGKQSRPITLAKVWEKKEMDDKDLKRIEKLERDTLRLAAEIREAQELLKRLNAAIDRAWK